MEYEIIDFVKANPLLYERKYSALKYGLLKMDKWRELGRLTRKDPNVLRRRWRSLRNSFAKKFKEKGGDVDEDDALGIAPRWLYYNHMKFLSSEYVNVERDTLQDFLVDNEEAVTDNAGQIEMESFDLNKYLHKHESSIASGYPNSSNGEQTTNQGKKSRLFKDSTINDAFKEMTLLLQKAKQHIVPPSHNQLFFNSVALQVDQAEMMPMDQMRLQQKVLELVTQEILIAQERTT